MASGARGRMGRQGPPLSARRVPQRLMAARQADVIGGQVIDQAARPRPGPRGHTTTDRSTCAAGGSFGVAGRDAVGCPLASGAMSSDSGSRGTFDA